MRENQNNHGSWAQVGDLVQLLSPGGEPCDIYGVVYAVEHSDRIGPRRYLRVSNVEGRTLDSYTRIVSRA